MGKSCEDKCKSCTAGGCSDRKSAQVVDLLEANHAIKKVIAVVSGKGGVGKSLVTSLLAVEAKRAGYRVGILDADITGPSIPKAFGISGEAKGNAQGMFPSNSVGGVGVMSINLLLPDVTDPVVWRGPMIANTVKQFYTDVLWDELDVLFVDMPPGTGDVPMTVFQQLNVAGIVMVTSPQDLVSMVVTKAVKMAQMMNVPILGLVENMSYFICDSCDKEHRIFGESKLENIAEDYKIDILAKIPMNPQFAALCDSGAIESVPATGFEAQIRGLVG